MISPEPGLRHFSDGALLVEYPGASDDDANAAAVLLAAALRREAPEGFHDAVPGARTLFCAFDPRRLSHERLAERVLSISEAGFGAAGADAPAREHRIPVVYGGNGSVAGDDAGPDLDEVARRAGLTADQAARIHAGAVYRVAFLGFAPGFAYLAGLPEALAAPRRPTPRPRVPGGSLAVAGPWSGIYPADGPGGWNLIGRAAVCLFDPDGQPPALLAPGDRVRFEPVSAARFQELEALGSASASASASAPPPASDSRSGPPLFRVAAPGLFSAVCGAPAFARAAFGVPPSGAMDLRALARGNAALGNPAGAAGLEVAVTGPKLEAQDAILVALSGAPCDASVDGRPLESESAGGAPFLLPKGSVLALGPVRDGIRAYLCVSGGLRVSEGLRTPVRISAGEELFGAGSGPKNPSARRAKEPESHAAPAASAASGAEAVVRIVLGPQENRFTPEGIATLLQAAFRVSSTSDRKGVRLEGPPLEFAGPPEIPSEGTPLGGIQVPGDGQPIVLGPDRPVTGGYPRIGTVIAADFPLVAQARPGSSMRFRQVTLAEALEARDRMDWP